VTRLDRIVEEGEFGVDPERLLTEGYAHALLLERQLRSIDRELAMLAERADQPAAARRLRRLAPRARALQATLDDLRERLPWLKDRVGYTSRERTA
jgi:hypothetical protein